MHASRYGDGWQRAVSTLNDTDQLLAAAGDALVSVEAVPIDTLPIDASALTSDDGLVNATCPRGTIIPHFEPGFFAARDRMPLSQAIGLLQRPPPGWRHYLNLDPAIQSTKGKGPRRGSPMHRAPFDQLQPPSFLPLGRGVASTQGYTASAEINLWLGGGQGTTQLHVDPYAPLDNISN